MTNKKEEVPGTDLHCHILPGIDDGAKDFSDALDLVEAEKEQGITQIAFTPHFYADRMVLTDFLKNRENAKESIKIACERRGVSFLLGAEVRMVPELEDTDLSLLSLSDTGYLLLEWPFYGYPIWGEELIDRLFEMKITPIFVHVERYDYFFETPERLLSYLEDGALAQVNAETIIKKETQKQALRLIRDGYVQLIASDAHNLTSRPPMLADAYRIVTRKLGEKTSNRLKGNANAVYHGEEI